MSTQTLTRTQTALQSEFLLSNQIGGYASSTLCGQNTRSYHGLLVAPNADLSDRIVYLSKLEEQVQIAGKTWELSTNQWNEVIAPRGFENIDLVSADSEKVIWTFNLQLQKTLKVFKGRNCIQIEYRNLSKQDLNLKLTPLVAFRSYHHVFAKEGQQISALAHGSEVLIRSNLFSEYLKVGFSGRAEIDFKSDWYRDMVYACEKERGLGHRENLFAPFHFQTIIKPEESFVVTVDLLPASNVHLQNQITPELQRLNRKFPQFKNLFEHSRDFVVKNNGQLKILAGYPWFTNWGRDTLIALPGLLLTTGYFEEAREILSGLLRQVHKGLIYNVYTEGSGYQFHSADASLLLFNALYQYVQKTSDYQFFKDHHFKLKEILNFYIQGTEFNIQLDSNHLLHAGAPGLALTWMDAKVGGIPVTPRSGYAIDLNALFYNALCVYDTLALKTQVGAVFEELKGKVLQAIQKNFWKNNLVYDFISKDGVANSQLRPNQLWTLALPFKSFPKEWGRRILEPVLENLVTPMGLRTLDPSDSQYAGRYEGAPEIRDGAYHQGTVWPWLFGIYGDAVEYVYSKQSPQWEDFKKLILNFADQIETSFGGLVPEIFDGDAPHAARGCVHQAWSCGELVRMLEKI